MQAIVAREFGGPEVLKLEEVPDPVAGPGQVRVRIHAVGVNPYDTYMRAGGVCDQAGAALHSRRGCRRRHRQVGAGVHRRDSGDRVYISGTAWKSARRLRRWWCATPHQVHRLPRASLSAGRRDVRAVRHGVARAVRPRQRAGRRHRPHPRRQRRRRPRGGPVRASRGRAVIGTAGRTKGWRREGAGRAARGQSPRRDISTRSSRSPAAAGPTSFSRCSRTSTSTTISP